MIEINLLPDDKRIKMRASATAASAAAKPGVPASENLKKLIYLVPATVCVLLLVHGFLAVTQISGSLRLAALEKKLQGYQPQMKNLAGFKAAFDNNSQDEKMMQELALKAVTWSKKLNRLSANLPAGIWINDFSATPRALSLKCSAVSLESDEVELINRFLSACKDDPDFFSDFTNFDLGSVQKRVIGTFEVADFTVSMEVKAR